MIATVFPSTIEGTLRVPTSKSAMQRALAASLLRKGRTLLRNPGHAEDDHAALRCIRALGATVEQYDNFWVIESQGIRAASDVLDCGESGLSIRMFTPLAALTGVPMKIVGQGSLINRPMRFFENVLPQLGVQVNLKNGCLPIGLSGTMRPASISVDGSLSSQFLTGLLMAFSAMRAEGVMIEVEELKSRPYIDLTIDTLRRFGLPTPRNEDYRRFIYDSSVQDTSAEPLEYVVEGDWSGASFWFAAAAVAGSIELTGLDPNSFQADRAIESLVLRAGVELNWLNGNLRIRRGGATPFEFDATDCPDLFPPLVALASCCRGVSVIQGVDRLTHKESDRGVVLREEFAKLGLTITLEGNTMKVFGGSGLSGGVVSARGDHRIAMSLAVAALGANGPVRIEGAESVRKSYPDFWEHLRSLGVALSLTD
jgi:3-phosphoshikimate 1-carboxyvinyltransferase